MYQLPVWKKLKLSDDESDVDFSDSPPPPPTLTEQVICLKAQVSYLKDLIHYYLPLPPSLTSNSPLLHSLQRSLCCDSLKVAHIYPLQTISLSGDDINSLDGIDALANLLSLEVSSAHSLMDVSCMSLLHKLKHVSLFGCYKLKDLSALRDHSKLMSLSLVHGFLSHFMTKNETSSISFTCDLCSDIQSWTQRFLNTRLPESDRKVFVCYNCLQDFNLVKFEGALTKESDVEQIPSSSNEDFVEDDAQSCILIGFIKDSLSTRSWQFSGDRESVELKAGLSDFSFVRIRHSSTCTLRMKFEFGVLKPKNNIKFRSTLGFFCKSSLDQNKLVECATLRLRHDASEFFLNSVIVNIGTSFCTGNQVMVVFSAKTVTFAILGTDWSHSFVPEQDWVFGINSVYVSERWVLYQN
ncbi:hypothetical protein RCL1_002796 [Eukaryota sp. TZLM3-RCL]